jgi:hypothetical protein
VKNVITNLADKLTRKADDDGPVVVKLDEQGRVIEDSLGTITYAKKPGRGKVVEEVIEYDDALKERALKSGLLGKEIGEGGGWREDQNANIYWLPLPELVEFEEVDAETPDNGTFWSWFTGFRKDKGINKKSQKVRWNDYQDIGYKKSDYSWTGWWKGWGYNSGSGLERRLAIALGAIQSTVNVVNTSGKRFVVSFAHDGPDTPMSYTDFQKTKVVVSPQALLDTSIAEELAIGITTGYGLHEASHVRDTMPIWPVLREPTLIQPTTVAAKLLNIVEDTRIERNTSAIFPGFAMYFEQELAYLWKAGLSHIPAVWGPELGDKLNAICASVKWPVEFKPFAEKDERLAEEYIWFNEWRDRYQAGADPRASVEEAIAHLREDEETKEQLEERQEQEEDAGGDPSTMSEDEFKEWLKNLKEQLEKGEIEPCPSPGQKTVEVKLTPEQAQEVNKLLREEFEEFASEFQMTDEWGKDNAPLITSIKPEEDDQSRSLYQKPDNLVDRLKAAFVFRKAAPLYANRLLRSGSLDEEEIWRIAGNDFRVFEQKHVMDTPETQVTLLVDLSGSMHEGTKIQTAQRLATVMLACLTTIKGVRVRVRGHSTGPRADGGTCEIFRLWEPGDPQTRLGLAAMLGMDCNFDGFAIEWCARELVQNQRPNEDMVLIVLSDGLPNGGYGANYGGGPAMDHVRRVTEDFEKRGVTTIQIAIDPSMRHADQARMFRHWLPYQDDAKLPFALTKLLIKLFGGE